MTTIKTMVVLGDSLSDPGNMNQKWVLRRLANLNNSGLGRFADGASWTDLVSLKRLEKALKQVRDDHDKPELGSRFYREFVWKLKKRGKKVTFGDDHTISDNFAIGGATAAVYPLSLRNLLDATRAKKAWFFFRKWGTSIWRRFADLRLFWGNPKTVSMYVVSRGFISGLYSQRQTLKKMHAQHDKDTTMVVEWTAANDFMTVNHAALSDADAFEVDKTAAINARIHNIRSLAVVGYKHFTIINLPDLAITPHIWNEHRDETALVSERIREFNQGLREALTQLRDELPDITISEFDAHKLFHDVHEQVSQQPVNPIPQPQPKTYPFSPKHLKDELIDDDQFKAYVPLDRALKDLSPPDFRQFMFWNELHPSTSVHEVLSDQFLAFMLKQGYDFAEDKAMLCQALGVHHIVSKQQATKAGQARLTAVAGSGRPASPETLVRVTRV